MPVVPIVLLRHMELIWQHGIIERGIVVFLFPQIGVYHWLLSKAPPFTYSPTPQLNWYSIL